ncbi:hypothetical protein MNBD_GAMMA22-2977 [hydrothermal vent metagenome]|uniref:Uncharacterized protein n=1 Tax=hydrothermal vent metagenome TaxID=652676 RepID=A0A3B1B2R3_9ZZZZ
MIGRLLLKFLIVIFFGVNFCVVSFAGKPSVGTEEFGLTSRQLVKYVEKVEALISACMREQGFQYIAADYRTIRKGMSADKNIKGVSEDEFIDKYGFGLSTLYTGEPPQLASGYSPAKAGLGRKNIEIFKNLSPSDRTAYNRSLFGENSSASFAVALETENLSFSGGCTLKATKQVFKPEQLKSSYYNPKDALISKDKRMKKAVAHYSREMRKAGFNYNHPDEVELDIRKRLAALTSGSTLPVKKMAPAQLAALKKLQEYERRVAKKNFQFVEEIFDPVEAKIEEEWFSSKNVQ